MKKIGIPIGMLALLIAAPVLAEDPAKAAPQGDQFQTHKAKMIHEMETRLACVKTANNQADIKKCHEAIKQQRHDASLDQIQNQRKRLDEKEQKLREKHD